MHHNHKILDYPAVSTFQNRLVQIYGPTFLNRFLPLTQAAGPFQLTGFVVSPHHARTSRIPQEIFVNGRPIKNTTISHAIYEGYRSFLPKGKHPQYIMCIRLDPQMLDINVHPTKREVRFSHPEILHSGILRAIKQIFVEGSSFAIESPDQVRGDLSVQPDIPAAKPTGQSLAVAQVSAPVFSPEMGANKAIHLSLFAQEPPIGIPDAQAGISRGFPLDKFTRHTYWDTLIRISLLLINIPPMSVCFFERLIHQWSQKDILQQSLLIPEPIDILPHQGALIDEWLPVLCQTGLDIERFGPTSYVVRAVPAILGSTAVGPLVLELLEELSEWKSTDSLETLIRPILATMACQSAVQAGRTMTLPEISTLLHDWAQENFPMTCPHGRRVAIRHSVEELNTLFARASEKHSAT